ncbi:MAG: HDOD domain-containing protein, partial [Desulfobulbus sp.]|nr:HDOD domain-containing protein [Desulfobulbus sp.]
MRKTILFVDDEPNILAGLMRNLRHMRKSMDFHFVESGEEALTCLAVHSVDIIVSDMRMPGMDGATLLSIVQERYPAVVRIMLSGQSDRESVLQTVATVHQFLTKPITAAVLQEKLHQACSYLDLMAETPLKSLICRTGHLPSQPAVFTELIQIIPEPDCSANDIAKIIERDLGMCAKIFQLVNSSFFGKQRKIYNPTDAVTLLGVDLIRELIFSAGIFKEMPPTSQPELFWGSLHDHNRKVAGLARLIIRDERLGKEAEDNAFLAGLLHDVGKLLFTSILDEQYCEVLRLAENESLL